MTPDETPKQDPTPTPDAETASNAAPPPERARRGGSDEDARARIGQDGQDDADRDEQRERATAGGPRISVTAGKGAQDVFGAGFEPNATVAINIGGTRYAGQKIEDDGTFRRSVPAGKVEVVGSDGAVLASGADD